MLFFFGLTDVFAGHWRGHPRFELSNLFALFRHDFINSLPHIKSSLWVVEYFALLSSHACSHSLCLSTGRWFSYVRFRCWCRTQSLRRSIPWTFRLIYTQFRRWFWTFEVELLWRCRASIARDILRVHQGLFCWRQWSLLILEVYCIGHVYFYSILANEESLNCIPESKCDSLLIIRACVWIANHLDADLVLLLKHFCWNIHAKCVLVVVSLERQFNLLVLCILIISCLHFLE